MMRTLLSLAPTSGVIVFDHRSVGSFFKNALRRVLLTQPAVVNEHCLDDTRLAAITPPDRNQVDFAFFNAVAPVDALHEIGHVPAPGKSPVYFRGGSFARPLRPS